MEEITMSANPNIPAIDNSPEANGGMVWHRLHSEREDICEALLREDAAGHETTAAQPMSNEDTRHAASWHRELLQLRLKKVDDALDRLMAGSYGECCKCGKWIEDTKLDFDPAIAYCLGCWDRQPTIH